MDKKTYNKIKSITISHEDFMVESLQDKENQRLWLETSFEEFAKNGNINAFLRALYYVIKARGHGAISQMAKDLKLNRSNLSDILNGKKEPKMQTTIKILNALGYNLILSQKVS